MMFRSALRSSNPTISIVVPALNEAKNLEALLPLLPEVHEVILVDGHSVDGTVETALRVLPSIKVIQQTRSGKGNALACGFEEATGDLIVTFDADGSADPQEIPAFVETLVKGADVAKGSRFRTGGGSSDLTFLRSLGNAALNLACNVLLETNYSDLRYGFVAFWRDVLPALDLVPTDLAPAANGEALWGDGPEIDTILVCRMAAAKFRVREVASFQARVPGESHRGAFGDAIRVLKTVFDEKRRDAQAVRLIRDERALTLEAVNAPFRLESERKAA
jgi:glycosyltransferase involved in cell wall biosynthesis